MTQPSFHPLKQVLNKIQKFCASGQASLIVFDLDSTLFDVGPRIEKIMEDFAQKCLLNGHFLEEIQNFHKFKVQRNDWGIDKMLIRAGISPHNTEFHRSIHDYWYEHFFSNNYLKFDVPYPGAVKFVKSIAQAGAEIVYLTGRDVFRMEEGSKEVLLSNGFPLDDQKYRLELKPHKSMDDALFKTDWFLNNHQGYDHVVFFENEPTNIYPLRDKQVPVDIIFFASTHSGRMSPPDDLVHIDTFSMDDED